MKIQKPKWARVLAVADLRHLREMGCTTRAKTIDTLQTQARQRAETRGEFGAEIEPCWTCRTIARKLGVPV